MRWNRIVAAGLLAGIVLVAFEAASEPLFRGQMEALFSRLGLPMPGPTAMLARVGALLALGIGTVWLYGSLEPRYGRGTRTAVVAGVAVWALTCLFASFVMYSFGIFPAQFFLMSATYSLPQAVASAMAGAWLYRRNALDGSGLAAARA
jgi:hypothetical protein